MTDKEINRILDQVWNDRPVAPNIVAEICMQLLAARATLADIAELEDVKAARLRHAVNLALETLDG